MALHDCFLYLAVILISARVASEIAGYLCIPGVIGELLAGLVLGPSVLAIAGKWLAGFAIREPRFVQTVIGLSMIPRGEVGLIFAQLGFANGILNAELYAALLIVISLITLLPPIRLEVVISALARCGLIGISVLESGTPSKNFLSPCKFA